MAGLPHLFDISSKKGEEFIKALFNNYTIVSEKLDGTRFEFQYDKSFKFFKRDPRNPITKIERTMMSVFERPIEHIEGLPNSIHKKLPKDFRFGFEYFVNNKPVNTLYDKMPLNHLVLTDIKIIDSGGRTKKVITDPGVLTKWAKILKVDEPPVLFNGKLSKEQKQELFNFVTTPFEDLVKKFETTSFVRFILSIVNPKLKSSFLQNDLDKPIEGIVFKFVKGQKDEFSAKVVDPLFTANARKKSAERKEPRKNPDSTSIVILDMVEYMRINKFKKYKLTGKDSEERYIELMADVFLDYIDTNQNKIKGYKIETPDFAKIPEFKLNSKFIKNKKLLNIVNSNELYHDLFKILLGTFKKIRKRATGIIDKDMMKEINDVIMIIDNKIKEPVSYSTNETLSFTEFLKTNN